MRNKIEKLKKKRLKNINFSDEVKESNSSGLCFIDGRVAKKIIDKLDSVELGAEKNKRTSRIYKQMKKKGIDADTLGGFNKDEFSETGHIHDYLKEEKFSEYSEFISEKMNVLDDNDDRNKKNIDLLQEEFKNVKNGILEDIKKINNDITSQSIKIIKKHSSLSGLGWKQSGHSINTNINLNSHIIVNSGQPKKDGDLANKKYVDLMAQRAAGMNRTSVPSGSPKTPVWYTREEVDSLVNGIVSDDAYGASWNGVTTVAPSKNAVYDKIESLVVGGGDFSDGGDAGGADRTLGNTDNYDLGFLTNNLNRLHIQNDGNVGIGITSPSYLLDINGEIALTELSSDPANPAEGKCVMWQSDGTDTGSDGDILMKITAGGITKMVTIVDFSVL